MKNLLLLTVTATALVLAGCNQVEKNIPEDAQTEEKMVEAIEDTTSQDTEEEAQTEEIEETEETTPVEEVLTEEQTAAYEAEKAEATKAEAALAEKMSTSEVETLNLGMFTGIAPGHSAKGALEVKDNGDTVIIQLSENFSSDKGPDLFVTLTKEQAVTGDDPVQLDKSKIKTVAPLVKLNGAQVYEVSKADYEAYKYAVVIWCREFNVVFGSATLN